jgi:hypothetical protein
MAVRAHSLGNRVGYGCWHVQPNRRILIENLMEGKLGKKNLKKMSSVN